MSADSKAARDAWREQLALVRLAVADLSAIAAPLTFADLDELVALRRALEVLHGRARVACK